MPNARIKVKRGSGHKATVAQWIDRIEAGDTIDWPQGQDFEEASGFHRDVLGTIAEMDGDKLVGYLTAMNLRDDAWAK